MAKYNLSATWERRRAQPVGTSNDSNIAAAEKRGYLRGLAEAEEIAVEVAANKHGSAGFVANKIAEQRRAAE